MEIWSSTQNTTETQAYAAQATGVANNKIVAKVKRLGVSHPESQSQSHGYGIAFEGIPCEAA